MHNALLITDPATGESVTLSELARRHGLHVSTLSRRYAAGIRGLSLVKPFSSKEHAAEQHAKTRAAAERKQSIISASNRALMRPLNHIGDANKMVGGGRHA